MAARGLLARWTITNAIGMSLAFLAFIQILMFLTFGLNFELHWSSELVESLEPVEAEGLLRIGLFLGLPVAGVIFTSSQVLAVRDRLPRARTWILAGPLGFAVPILVIWPLTAVRSDQRGATLPSAFLKRCDR